MIIEKNKLKYIENLHTDNLNRVGQNILIKKIDFMEFLKTLKTDKNLLTIIDQEIKKFRITINKEIEEKFFIEFFRNLDHKFSVLKFYMNMIIFTAALRYIEIPLKVKYGGIMYYSSFLIIFYFLNKNFNKFKTFYYLNTISKVKKVEIGNYIDTIKYDYKKLNKENLLTKKSLKKYWKEPMAWH